LVDDRTVVPGSAGRQPHRNAVTLRRRYSLRRFESSIGSRIESSLLMVD
jgi:hypothetical protein